MDVPEWLSGMTRNHVGSARAGSNPAVHALSPLPLSFLPVSDTKIDFDWDWMTCEYDVEKLT